MSGRFEKKTTGLLVPLVERVGRYEGDVQLGFERDSMRTSLASLYLSSWHNRVFGSAAALHGF